MEDNPHLKHTPLHALHLSLGARMVPFAGYEMPVQYPDGVMKEHQHTRVAAGLFDVSHMGQVIVRPKSGKIEDAALALEPSNRDALEAKRAALQALQKSTRNGLEHAWLGYGIRGVEKRLGGGAAASVVRHFEDLSG